MDLLVVAHREDALAGLVALAAQRRGRRVEVVEHGDAARLFTIAGDDDGTRVEPAVPVLLRAAWPAPRRGRDAEFLAGEAAAALWAALATTAAPVVNRPTHHGYEGRWTVSGAACERRAGRAPAPERYLRVGGRIAPPTDEPWAIEPATGRTRRWTRAGAAGPARARPILVDEAYQPVVVVGAQAWATRDVDLPGLDLEGESVAAAARLDLAFAVVTWGIGGDAAAPRARLARIDPYPRAEQVLPVWPEASAALLGALAC